jgi:hypothetical protein
MKGTAIVAVSVACGVGGLEPNRTTARKTWASFKTTVHSLRSPPLYDDCTIVSFSYILLLFLSEEVHFLVFIQAEFSIGKNLVEGASQATYRESAVFHFCQF